MLVFRHFWKKTNGLDRVIFLHCWIIDMRTCENHEWIYRRTGHQWCWRWIHHGMVRKKKDFLYWILTLNVSCDSYSMFIIATDITPMKYRPRINSALRYVFKLEEEEYITWYWMLTHTGKTVECMGYLLWLAH